MLIILTVFFIKILDDVTQMKEKVKNDSIISSITMDPAVQTISSKNTQLNVKTNVLRNDPNFNLDFGLLPNNLPELGVVGYITKVSDASGTDVYGGSFHTCSSINSQKALNMLLLPETARNRVHDMDDLITSVPKLDKNSDRVSSNPATHQDDTNLGDPGFDFGEDGNIQYHSDANPDSFFDYRNDNQELQTRDVQADRELYENMNEDHPGDFLNNGYDSDSQIQQSYQPEDDDLLNLDLDPIIAALDENSEINQGNSKDKNLATSIMLYSNRSANGLQKPFEDGNKTGASSKSNKRCLYDSENLFTVQMLQGFRDNYNTNMTELTKRRKLSNYKRQNRYISLSNFAQISIPTPFSNLFALNFWFDNDDEYRDQHSNTHFHNVSEEVEIGRLDPNGLMTPNTGFGNTHDLNLSSSGGVPSIPRSWSSPFVRTNSSPLLPSRMISSRQLSTLDGIPEVDDNDDYLRFLQEKLERGEALTDRERYELETGELPADYFNGPEFDEGYGNNILDFEVNSSFSESPHREAAAKDYKLNFELKNVKYNDFGTKEYHNNFSRGKGNEVSTRFNDDNLFLKYSQKMAQALNSQKQPQGLISDDNSESQTNKDTRETEDKRLSKSRLSSEGDHVEPYSKHRSSSSSSILHHQTSTNHKPDNANKLSGDYVAFDYLFPPSDVNKKQAAAAFFRVLKLVTNNKMKVKQVSASVHNSNRNQSNEKQTGIWLQFT